MKRKYYNRLKEDARTEAFEWQLTSSDETMSYNELAEVGERFHTIGTRYGLLKEFRDNGIPC